MDELQSLISRTIRLSYYRGIDSDNPIDFRMQPDGVTLWIIMSSFTEPTFSRTPYNVLWLVMDPSDNNYGKLLRRVSHEAQSFTYRSEWVIVTTLEDAYSEMQYYRPVIIDPWLYGIDDPNVNLPKATNLIQGIAKLEASPGNTVYPIGIVEDDARMSDDRYPNSHTHPNYARSMIKINATTYALIDSSVKPAEGTTLFLRAAHPTLPNVFLAEWRLPYETDVTFVDRSLVSITIQGPTTVNEQSSENYTVLATYADGTSSLITPDTWTITQNPEAASINRVTGVLTTNDIISNTPIIMSASFTHKGVTKTDTHNVMITAGVELVGLSIRGPDTVNSGSTTAFSVYAEFSNATESLVQPSSFASSHLKTSVTPGPKLVVQQIFVNGSTVLSASYAFAGVTLNATKNVSLVAAAILPVSLTIVGDTQVSEGSESSAYTYTVAYNDGHSETKTSVNSLTTNNPTVAKIINPNKLTIVNNSITQDTVIRLNASYTESGVTLTDYLDVLAVNVVQVVPSAMRIRIQNGPDANASSHNENQSLTVIYQAEFNNNPGVWTDVSADAGFTAALVSPTNGATLSSDKLTLTLPEVTGNKNVTIQASIVRNGVTKSANYVVTIVDTTVYLNALRVRLSKAPNAGNSSTEDENQTLGLVYTAQYSDKPTQWVPVSANNPNLAVSLTTANGATLAADKTSVTLPDVSSNTNVIISATLTDAGTNKTDTYTINVVDTTVKVTGFRIRLATAPSANTNASSHVENQTLNVVYQIERSNAPGVWTSINGDSKLSAVVVAPANGVAFGTDITKVVLPNVTGDKTATIRGTYNNDGTPMTADYIFTITDVVVTLVELRIRLESDPTNTSASSTHDENQTIRLIYRARFSDSPSTWVDVSTDPKLSASIAPPALGVAYGTDKRDLILPDVTSDSSVELRATYTLNGKDTLTSYTVNIKNVSVGPAISPRWGKAPVQAFVADYATEAFYSQLNSGNLTGVNGEEITTGNSPDQQSLWYLMFPKAWGYIYIVNKGNGFAGSWDGGKITTQDGSFGSPAEVKVSGEDFYIYRVTFPYGNGPITWAITYGSSSPDSGAL